MEESGRNGKLVVATVRTETRGLDAHSTFGPITGTTSSKEIGMWRANCQVGGGGGGGGGGLKVEEVVISGDQAATNHGETEHCPQ